MDFWDNKIAEFTLICVWDIVMGGIKIKEVTCVHEYRFWLWLCVL